MTRRGAHVLALLAALGGVETVASPSAHASPPPPTEAQRPARPARPPAPAAASVVPAGDRRVGAQAVVTRPSGLPEPGIWASLRGLTVLDTPLDPGLGTYRATRVRAEGRWGHDLSRRVQLVLDLSAERARYSFSAPASLVPGTGSLVGDTSGAQLGATVVWSVTPAFGLTLGASVRSLVEDGAAFEDGVSWGGIGAVRLRVFGTSNVFLGAVFNQGLEGDPYVLPILGLGGLGGRDERSRWRVQARGPGVVVYYLLSPSWAIGVQAGYERRDIRLAPDDRLPGGVLRERRLPVGLEVAWRRREAVTLSLGAGVSIYNVITLLDQNGTCVTQVMTDPAPYVQLELALHW